MHQPSFHLIRDKHGATTFSIETLIIMTFSIKASFATFSITAPAPLSRMLHFIYCYDKCRDATNTLAYWTPSKKENQVSFKKFDETGVVFTTLLNLQIEPLR
jgi:hypothetical protein